jgi:hypothetical protein
MQHEVLTPGAQSPTTRMSLMALTNSVHSDRAILSGQNHFLLINLPQPSGVLLEKMMALTNSYSAYLCEWSQQLIFVSLLIKLLLKFHGVLHW